MSTMKTVTTSYRNRKEGLADRCTTTPIADSIAAATAAAKKRSLLSHVNQKQNTSWYQTNSIVAPSIKYNYSSNKDIPRRFLYWCPSQMDIDPLPGGGTLPPLLWVFRPQSKTTTTEQPDFADPSPNHMYDPAATPMDLLSPKTKMMGRYGLTRSEKGDLVWVVRPRSNTQQTITNGVMSSHNNNEQLGTPTRIRYPEKTKINLVSPEARSDEQRLIPRRLVKESNAVSCSRSDRNVAKKWSDSMPWLPLGEATTTVSLGSKDDPDKNLDDTMEKSPNHIRRPPPLEGATVTTVSYSKRESDGEEVSDNTAEESPYALLLPPMEGAASSGVYLASDDEEEEVSANNSGKSAHAIVQPPTVSPARGSSPTVTCSGGEDNQNQGSSDDFGSPMEVDDKEEHETDGEATPNSPCDDQRMNHSRSKLIDSESDEGWMVMYELLTIFREEHGGSTDVPRTKKHQDLFEWCRNQRRLYNRGKLRKDRVAYLLYIGFDLNRHHDYNKHSASWMKMYLQLVEYKKKHGTIQILAAEGRKYHKLKVWMKKQQRYCKLQYRIDLLNKIGFDWTSEKTTNDWDSMYNHLVEYKKKHGTTKLPKDYNIDPKLVDWVSSQTKRSLDTIKISLLNAIDFEWPPIDSEDGKEAESKWMKTYEQLVIFHKRYRHTRVTKDYDVDGQLASWVNFQRSNCKDAAHIRLLNKLGLEWNLPSKTFWDVMFQRLVVYKKKYGSFRVSRRLDNGLAVWVTAQRERCTDPRRIERLNAIGFEWEQKNKKVKWEDMYERLAEYKSKYGTTFVDLKEDHRLFNWVHNQRYQCKDPARVALLNKLGFLWKRGEKYREV